jgi:hypothetical protein
MELSGERLARAFMDMNRDALALEYETGTANNAHSFRTLPLLNVSL